MKPPQSLTVEELLEHSDWVRSLARRLLRDDSKVDDVVQQTWVSALQNSPSSIRSVRGWLTTVMRNVVRREERSRRRREHHEAEAPELPMVPSPAQVVEREQVRRGVIEAVLELKEPYRSTLLLRFYEDLQPTEIAKALGVPPPTIRTRLKRGLEQIRVRMDQEHSDRPGGGRAALLFLLGPHAMPPLVPVDPTGALISQPTTIFTLKGLAIAAVMLVGASFWAWNAWQDEPLPSLIGAEAPENASALTLTGPLDVDRSIPAAVTDPPDPDPDPEGWSAVAHRLPASIRGLVLLRETGAPVSGALVRASPGVGPVAGGPGMRDDRLQEAATGVTGTQGEFHLTDLVEGPYRIVVEDPRGHETSGWSAAVADGSFVQFWLTSEPALFTGPQPLTVKAFGLQRRPAAGVTMRLVGRDRNGPQDLKATTDLAGEAVFQVRDLQRAVILAESSDGLLGRIDLASDGDLSSATEWLPEDGDFRPVLAMDLHPAGRIEGRLSGGAGRIRAVALSYPHTYGASARLTVAESGTSQGRFELDGLAPGTYLLQVESDDRRLRLRHGIGATREQGDIEYLPPVVEVVAGVSLIVELSLVPGASLEGVVTRGVDGRPVSSAKVRALLPQGPKDFPLRERRAGARLVRLDAEHDFSEWSPVVSRETTTDSEGRYSFAGLLPSSEWTVEVLAPSLSNDLLESVRLVDAECTTLSHELVEAGVVQGVAWEKASLGIRRLGEDQLVQAILTPREPLAPFTIAGLKPGEYEFLSVGEFAQTAGEVVVLHRVTVRAGELTWVDLRDVFPEAVSGTVTYRGNPQENVVLGFPDGQVATDASGQFRFPRGDAPSKGVWFNVAAPGIEGSVPLRLSFPEGEFDGRIELPDARLELCVLDSSGEPTAGSVTMRPILTEEEIRAWKNVWSRVPPEASVMMRNHYVTLQTDSNGLVQVQMLPPGRYALMGRTARGVHSEVHTVEIGPGSVSRLELRPAARTGSLSFHATLPGGRPASGRAVSVFSFGEQGHRVRVLQGRLDSNGSLHADGLPAGTIVVEVGDTWRRDRPSPVGFPTPLRPVRGFAPGFSRLWRERRMESERPGPFVVAWGEVARGVVDVLDGQLSELSLQLSPSDAAPNGN